MKKIQEIKALYPDIDINLDGITDAFNESFPIVERDPIAVIIKHPKEELYLMAKWKSCVWNGFLTGGIEDGDTLEQAVQKEIHEETGYKNISKIILEICKQKIVKINEIFEQVLSNEKIIK